jgi:putative addiction module killer protein
MRPLQTRHSTVKNFFETPLDNLLNIFNAHYVKTIRRTGEFDKWFNKLRDPEAKARILARIKRLAEGNPGDVKPAGEGVSEMRIDYGPGYRVYYKDAGKEIIILLCGGDKTTQQADIDRAKKIDGMPLEEEEE